MKSNKGFTLIELLAVIVILAIIALIASPIIIGLIDDARKEAAASSAHGVLKSAENVFAKVLIKNNGDGLSKYLKYTFGTGGSVDIDASTDGSTGWEDAVPSEFGVDAATIQLDYNGTKPTGGVLTLNKNGSVTVNSALIINGYTCSQTDGEFECGDAE